jgi:hypothetical protein
MKEDFLRLFRLSLFRCLLLLSAPEIAEAVMVDFESPPYTAAATFNGVDGWAHWGGYAGSTVVTPDSGGSGDTTVLSGAQSARMSGSPAILYRVFDAGPTTWDTGSVVSGHMMMSGPAGRVDFFYSENPSSASTPGGIMANVGGTFQLFGGIPGYVYDTGVPSLSNTDYLLELEMNLDDNSFTAYATESGGVRTELGNLPLVVTIDESSYPSSGFILATRGDAVGVFDDLDVTVVGPPPPDPPLPEPVDFEADTYIAGRSVFGKDGWEEAIWTGADARAVNTTVLEGTQSLRLTGDPGAAARRRFGEGTTVDNGSIVSTIMMADGPEGSAADFYFSHAIDRQATPAGIAGRVGGNFWIFGKKDGEIVSPGGIETTVPFASNVEYLLELRIDFTNLTFDSYVTDLTNGGERTFLGEAELWFAPEHVGTPEPSDGANAGYIAVTRDGAVAYYDVFNCVAGTTPELEGDLDGDGFVGSADLDIVRANWGQPVDPGCLSCGDPSGDGAVGSADLDIVRANWGAAVAATVPEPRAAVPLVIGWLIGGLTGRRRCNRTSVESILKIGSNGR